MIRKKNYWVGLLPLFIIAIMFLFVPIIFMFLASFQLDVTNEFSMNNYIQALTNPYYYQAFGNSILIAAVSSVIGIVGSLIFSYALIGLSESAQEKLTLFSNLAANFAGIPLAFGFIIILGNSGLLKMVFPILKSFDLYTWKGLVLTYTYFQIPLATLFIYPVMRKVKKEWQESAEMLGATTFLYLRKVVFPFLVPTISGTFAILFANGMGTYETAYALVSSNVGLITTRIAALVAGDVYAKPNVGSTLSVVFVVSMICVIFISQYTMKKLRKDLA
ncbi:hypothetical protein A5819_002243 [Enterococcus sp. 7E2_DIV0204]|uniref:ABC transporter permease n=2 Tax=unclassified Enterococcus TaxID=2608891 RepID=UPI000A3413C6|nr:ABC transporter permease subunit [Enterococcus sp. 7E2_DIV0204]OTN89745.1 hypothetical protein A5819_002243 [Enterococcus sp. 7E2_DIV0204]